MKQLSLMLSGLENEILSGICYNQCQISEGMCAFINLENHDSHSELDHSIGKILVRVNFHKPSIFWGEGMILARR